MWNRLKEFLKARIKQNNDKMVRYGTSYHAWKSAAYREVLEFMKKLEERHAKRN